MLSTTYILVLGIGMVFVPSTEHTYDSDENASAEHTKLYLDTLCTPIDEFGLVEEYEEELSKLYPEHSDLPLIHPQTKLVEGALSRKEKKWVHNKLARKHCKIEP